MFFYSIARAKYIFIFIYHQSHYSIWKDNKTFYSTIQTIQSLHILHHRRPSISRVFVPSPTPQICFRTFLPRLAPHRKVWSKSLPDRPPSGTNTPRMLPTRSHLASLDTVPQCIQNSRQILAFRPGTDFPLPRPPRTSVFWAISWALSETAWPARPWRICCSAQADRISFEWNNWINVKIITIINYL